MNRDRNRPNRYRPPLRNPVTWNAEGFLDELDVTEMYDQLRRVLLLAENRFPRFAMYSLANLFISIRRNERIKHICFEDVDLSNMGFLLREHPEEHAATLALAKRMQIQILRFYQEMMPRLLAYLNGDRGVDVDQALSDIDSFRRAPNLPDFILPGQVLYHPLPFLPPLPPPRRRVRNHANRAPALRARDGRDGNTDPRTVRLVSGFTTEVIIDE